MGSFIWIDLQLDSTYSPSRFETKNRLQTISVLPNLIMRPKSYLIYPRVYDSIPYRLGSLLKVIGRIFTLHYVDHILCVSYFIFSYKSSITLPWRLI